MSKILSNTKLNLNLQRTEMNTRLPYKCKFCGKPGYVDYEDLGLFSESQIVEWLTPIACPKCAHFERSRDELSVKINNFYFQWRAICRGEKVSDEVRLQARRRMQVLLLKLCELVEKFKDKHGIFQAKMVDELIGFQTAPNRTISKILNA
jgi:hypothetical protein